MDEHVTGRKPGEAAAPEESGLAERLIHDEFADGAPTQRARFHRDAKAARRNASPAADGERRGAVEETAQIPVVATAAAGETRTAASIHDEFAEPARPPRSRSHRAGMLAGLGVVGVLLAALVLLAPGSGKPRLPAQSVHDVSPISASGPKTAAATAPTTAAPSTTPSTAGPSTTTTQPHRSETVPSTVTYVYLPGTTTPAETPTTSAAAPTSTPTTAPAPPPTTTTTSPSSTTTTTRQCLLGVICN